MGVVIIYVHAQLSSHDRARALKKGKKEVNKCDEKNLFQIKRDIGMVLLHEL